MASTVGNRTFDPQKPTTCSGEYWTLSLVYARLIQLTPDFKLQPMLAKSWTYSSDGKTLTLSLRTDVKFKDGSPFNAAAVKANLDRAMTYAKSTIKPDLASVASVDVVDDSTVRINLKPGDGAQLPYLLSQCAGMIINPASLTKPDLDQTGDGLGPYTVEPGSFHANDSSTLVRAPGAWWGDPAVGPHFARIEAHTIADGKTEINQVASGQIDITNTAGADDLTAKQDATSNPGALQFVPFETNLAVAIAVNIKSPVTSSLPLRQALNVGLDRQGIAQAAFNGECTPTVQPALPNNVGYDASLEKTWAYNADKAKQYLTQANYTGAVINALQHTVSQYAPANEAAQALYKKVGINYVLSQPQSSTQAIPAFLAGKYDTFGFPLGSALYPTQMIADYTNGRYTIGATTDNIKNAAVGLLDPAKSDSERADIAKKTNAAIVNDSTIINICTIKKGIFASSKVVNADKTSLVKLGVMDVDYMEWKAS